MGLTKMLEDGFCLLKFPYFVHNKQTYFSWIVFREGFESDALRLKALVKQDTSGIDPTREHEIGEILSYSKVEVDAYLRHVASRQV